MLRPIWQVALDAIPCQSRKSHSPSDACNAQDRESGHIDILVSIPMSVPRDWLLYFVCT